MASAQVVETSVTNNSPSQDSNHPDDLFQSRYVTPGFKPFSYQGKHSNIAKEISDRTREGGAYDNLDSVCQLLGDFGIAVECHEKPLMLH